LVEGATVSGTVAAPGAANDGGICAYATGPDGAVDGQSVTGAAGAYVLADLAPQAYTVNFDPTCSHSQGSYFGPVAYPKRLGLGAGEALGGVDATLPLVSGTPVAITQASLAQGKVYHRYYQAVTVTLPDPEGSPWQVSGLPRGLTSQGGVSFSDQDAAIEGDIYGIPQVAGTFTVTVTVATVGMVPPLVASKTFKLMVLPATPVVSVLSSTVKVSGQFVPVRLFCTYVACSGRAKLTTREGVVLANAAYALEKSTSGVVKLELTNAGSVAFAKAKQHPVNAELEVTAGGGKEVTEALRVS
jgi:hypothetical protein